jgi:hypothetical protein
MFDITCSTCARRQLIFAGQVLGVLNDEKGIHVAYRCTCGSTGVWDTGRAANRTA